MVTHVRSGRGRGLGNCCGDTCTLGEGEGLGNCCGDTRTLGEGVRKLLW